MSNVETQKKLIEQNEVLAKTRAREIVSEIHNFGVTQIQILAIIRLLVLEVENREMMLGIISCLDGNFVPEPKNLLVGC